MSVFGNRKALQDSYTYSNALCVQLTLYNLVIYQMSSPQRPLLGLLSETVITQMTALMHKNENSVCFAVSIKGI